MDVLRSNADALVLVDLQRPWIDRHRKLLLVRGPKHTVALDAAAKKHRRADRPVILAVARVVVRCSPHFTLHDDDQLLANLQFPRATNEVSNAGEKLRDQFHLVAVVVRMTVELTNVQVGGNTDA